MDKKSLNPWEMCHYKPSQKRVYNSFDIMCMSDCLCLRPISWLIRGSLLSYILRTQDTVDFWTSEHPLAQPVSYCKNFILLCSGGYALRCFPCDSAPTPLIRPQSEVKALV